MAGGGPAGIIFGYLMARAGIDVVVLEKWPDFFRDFRGDTVHPSTMSLLDELGILEDFLELPHQEIKKLAGNIGGEKVVVADFTHLRFKCPFIAFIPQWDFLNFIAGKAKQYNNFHLMMETEAVDLIKEDNIVRGVQAKDKNETFEIRCDLVVGADGRHSTVREKAGFAVKNIGSPMDVLWFKITRQQSDPDLVLGFFDAGKIMVMIDRGTYWQCGFVIKKGSYAEIQQLGIAAFQKHLLELAPFLKDRVQEIADWPAIKTLSVSVDRLEKWFAPGVLCIGDSAHAMSPIGGVGINLAVQDAVAAANILIPKFKKGSLGLQDLNKVQKRRMLPTKVIQSLQVLVQNKIISHVLSENKPIRFPWVLRLVRALPVLAMIPAYLIGSGFRPEHINKKIFD